MAINEDRLYIPGGIRTRKELFPGFGSREVAVTFLVFLASVGVNIVLWFILHSLIVIVVSLMIIMATTIMLVMKDRSSNISVIDQIKFMINFSKGQKKYIYRRRNHWLKQ